MAENLRCAQVYLAENKVGIVTAMHFNSAGIYYEQGAPSVLDFWRNGPALAASLRSSLERFSFREANLRFNRYAPDEEISRQLLKLFDVCRRWTADSL